MTRVCTARQAGVGARIRSVPPLEGLLLAHGPGARVFDRHPDNGALREVIDRGHGASRLSHRHGGGDRPCSARRSAAWTAFEPHTAPAERELLRFARETARLLEDAALAPRRPGLLRLASHPFLGTLLAQAPRRALPDIARP
jgi:Protein required for attachment to host cells